MNNRQSPFLVWQIFAFLPAISGCVTDDQSATIRPPTSHPATQTGQYRPPLTVEQIKATLAGLPAWPEERRDFSAAEWLEVLEFARDLQGTDPTVALTALREYVRQFFLPYNGPLSAVAEWSKVYILLRVVFDVPSDKYDERKHTLPPVSGGGYLVAYPSKSAADRASGILSKPLLWTKEGPRLLSRRAGYSGAPYSVDYEWSRFQAHYRYRQLDDAIVLLRSLVGEEIGADPSATQPARGQGE